MFQNKCTIRQKYYGVAFEFFCLFSQLPAAEKDTNKWAAGNFLGPSYFETTLEQFFLTASQNNFGNKIPLTCLKGKYRQLQ